MNVFSIVKQATWIKQPRELTSWGNKRTSFHCKIKTAIDSGNELINHKRKSARMGTSIHFTEDSRKASQLRERLIFQGT